MIGLAKALPKVDPGRQPTSFLAQKVYWSMIDWLRTCGSVSRHMRARGVLPPAALGLDVEDHGDAPDARAERIDEAERVLGKVPSRERRVLELYYLQELTMREIAEKMGVSQALVSNLRKQAVRGLLGGAG